MRIEIHPAVRPEPDPFALQEPALLRPPRNGPAGTVDHPVTGQSGRRMRKRPPGQPGTSRAAGEKGELTVSRNPPRRNRRNQLQDPLFKPIAIHGHHRNIPSFSFHQGVG